MMKKVNLITLSGILSLFIACSSDSALKYNQTQDETSQIVKGKMAKIDESNQESVLASSMSAFQLDESINDFNGGYRLADDATDRVYANKVLRLTVAKRVASQSCSSGKVTIDDHDNGEYQDVDVTFEKCVNNGVTIDGLIHYDKITDESNVDATIHNLNISFEDKEVFYESANIKLRNNYLKEKLTGYAKDSLNRVTFKDFNIEFNNTMSKKIYDVDGSLSTTCINNEWIDIKTTKSVEQNNSNDCPDSGEIEIKGNNSTLTAKYNSDESVEIYLDGNLTKSYSSCDEMSSEIGSECNL